MANNRLGEEENDEKEGSPNKCRLLRTTSEAAGKPAGDEIRGGARGQPAPAEHSQSVQVTMGRPKIRPSRWTSLAASAL